MSSADQASVASETQLELIERESSSEPRLLRVMNDNLVAATFIIESSSALEILLEPWTVGARLAHLARSSSVDFLKAAGSQVNELKEARFENVTEVVPLAGALYYSMAEAFETVFGEAINRCFIGAKRNLTPTGWMTELSYENFEAMSPEPIILIGDTIATGGTIESIINATVDNCKNIEAIVIYSIAGGLVGAIRISKLAEKLEIPIYQFYSNAIFGVEPNGTDMPWLHPGTIVSQQIRERAESTYGPDLGRRWCSIWDWGDRAKHPIKHLTELIERCEDELAKDVTEETKSVLEEFLQETQDALKKWKGPIQKL
ncbi:MAG: hypothetical protein JSW61_08460 [Candidatus Thorarchaeota archaeon]|nr:MAG: hypothetical protein JSW61_08460 [Candidatus Thorarchaeota archaeon]